MGENIKAFEEANASSNKNYRILTLYSGSSGNSVLVEHGDTAILIDAGKSARSLCASLKSVGSDIDRIGAIFITHEHSDHVSALEVICKSHSIPVHIMRGSASRFDRCDTVKECLNVHDGLICERIGNMTVRAFRTPHDSLMSVGYRIDLDSGVSVGVATDIGHVTDEIFEGLCGCEAIVLEANHDLQMLEDGPYPRFLKDRILSRRGHLSNSDSALFGARLVQNGTRGFLLAHLSRENNLPELAYDAFCSSLGDSGVSIYVASADEPTELCVN